ncbi:MAG: hypothetical protein A3E98_01540 [Candidatus Doudnabacteria bacterium RIFCSPHIGHO2_12_FULL_48_11]|uniref:Uncharacterized protein n=1 Tax=Candidatus Doudnabacteria bacterium RIFCSPHIGHO2_01_FULL_46_24 TaxID=1817825 RepID=A0A1F5NVV0_9BACT|nr:MAG: hypothetical protein A2720_00100 [Candidatus Doudnabacteria bacterium RIFCSPHIGHO2_01_FULL_46_24]OGE95512.1 MAG: hypothetical protein A3E98_01540 [Candidatus Doudnabacteria bacterium RIFCSPHIGHO2_12_FULL_48_11]
MSKYIKYAQIASMVLSLVLVVSPFLAGAQYTNPNPAGTGLPGDTRLSEFILKIINIALAIAGLIAVLFLIIGGFRYITAAGNEEAGAQAKKIITNSIIGIVVIILSFVIVRVISSALISQNI